MPEAVLFNLRLRGRMNTSSNDPCDNYGMGFFKLLAGVFFLIPSIAL